jgi:hypothetical protein
MVKIGKNVFLAGVVAAAFLSGPGFALAHQFKVVLVVPATEAGMAEALELQNGFVLATTERDGHPDEVSDGHLGGLDVYVTVLGGTEETAAGIEAMAGREAVDIVAALAPAGDVEALERRLDGLGIALLLPGETPFGNSGDPAVRKFASAYGAAYGDEPGPAAAQGYNAARRIDVAVRGQGGADDATGLSRSFESTAKGFSWR